MALNSGKILMRRGQEVNFDPNKMMPGEWAVSLDSKFVRMCFSPGVCIRMATYEAFEADMEQIRGILAECQTVEEAVQRIYEDIKDVAVDVERIEAAAASALKSEENALNSANSAVQSANTATQKASEAVGSANIASTKAEQATEGASTATQKANEAADSADNVRNMSSLSQSYAIGGTGTREGEDTDNAKYYNQQASDNADRAEEAAERASAVADVGVATTEKAGLVKPDGETIRVDSDGTIHADRGTTSYTDLENKPKINDVVLEGEKTLEELGIASKEALEKTDNKVNIIIENAELRFKETASGEYIHLYDSADSKLVEFALYGKAVQSGTPTPQNPVDIEVAGSDGSVEVKSVGKNLLEYPYQRTTSVVNGIDFTDNGDGTITANGTATALSVFYIKTISSSFYLEKGNYILSGNPSGGTASTYKMRLEYGSNKIIGDDIGNGVNVNITSELSNEPLQLGIMIYSGQTVSNLTFKPMIRLASDTDSTYEPYKSKTASIPTENGLAGIPVDSGGNYTDSNGQQWICDEIVKYADGSGEKIQRVGIIDSYSAETITGVYMSTTGELTEGTKILYQLAKPITTSLTAEELAEIEKLSTFYPVTNISNDGGCGMKVKYIVDSKNYIDNQLAIQAKLQEESLLNMLLLMPEEVQASMIEKDTNNLLNESEV